VREETQLMTLIYKLKTTVSSQSYTTQRDPFVFPSPDLFSPDRWISTQGGTDAMRELMLVWGKGNRACLGRTMATMELKIATAAIMRRYSVRLASQKTNDDMRMTDHFTLIPKGKQCFLIFENAASE